ncbi:MAG: hypothetical protein C0606_17400 [Hyphomicrobiales bacterium]|nr:MAG: hypothetical protein C0606_17400 [Hyphomicrobiales bacterium]
MARGKLDALKGTIFIVTYGRSGSTLLQTLLQSIPDSHILGENYNALMGLFQAAKSVRRSRAKKGGKERPANDPWYGASGLVPKRFEHRLARVFLEEVLQVPEGCRWVGFKEIRYTQAEDDFDAFLMFIRRAFPNAFFVFNSRNVDDVMKSKWWANQPPEKVRKLVLKMDERFAEFAKEHPDFSHHVFYEQTVADPKTLQPLFDKLGEPLNLELAHEKLAERLTH